MSTTINRVKQYIKVCDIKPREDVNLEKDCNSGFIPFPFDFLCFLDWIKIIAACWLTNYIILVCLYCCEYCKTCYNALCCRNSNSIQFNSSLFPMDCHNKIWQSPLFSSSRMVTLMFAQSVSLTQDPFFTS